MLWRSAPPVFRMRSSAPITAILAFASLFPAPAALAATQSSHRTAAHKAAPAPAAKKKSHKRQADETVPATRPHSSRKRRSKKHSTEETPAPITIERIHATPGAHPGKRRKATSDDFVKAAKGAPTPTRSSATLQKEEDEDQPVVAATEVTKNSNEEVASATRLHKPVPDSVDEEAATPVIIPSLYNKRGRLIVPRPLKGSHEILVRQNVVADRDGLDRIQDDDDLVRMREAHLLVGLPVSNALDVDDRLPANRRYARPWTAQFLSTLARAHYARFHTSLQVNSAVRTVEFQQRLMRTNGNAAPAEGETASPHLTGQAIDIAKHGLSLTEIAWLRGYLLPLIQQGRIDVEEEFQQACFHISVYKKYAPSTSVPRRNIATTHRSGTSALATAIQ